MSMHRDFTAPLSTYDDLSPETLDYHLAHARVLRSQAMAAQIKSLFGFVKRLFVRPESAARTPGGYAANQS